ncbi:MAG: histidine kinase, partial [Acidimicrobiia bacterium]
MATEFLSSSGFRAWSRSATTALALGALGILVGASIVTIALCEPDVCTGVNKPWPWGWDVLVAASFLGVAGLISVQAPESRLAWVLGVIGAAKLAEMNLGEYGDPVLWQAGRMAVIALVWHAALSFPRGDPGRVGWWLSAAWVGWAVLGWSIRAMWAIPDTLNSGIAIQPTDSAPAAAGAVLAAVEQVGNLLILVTLGVLLTRFARGDRPTRRAMAPLLLIVPIVLLTVVDEVAVDQGWMGDRFLEASQWAEFAILAVPWGIAAGLARSRLWGGEVAELVAAAEAARTPAEVEAVAARTLGDPTARLGLARPGTDELVDVEGRPFEALDGAEGEVRLHRPLVVDGRLIGVLEHAAGVPEALAAQTAATIGLAVDRQRLQAEVRAQMAEVVDSRRRVVAAADEARRRVERDLHDGAQQRLLALAMEAERLRGRLAANGGSAELVALAGSLVAGAREAHGELRELAAGMYPPMLEAEGLGAAIESLADRLGTSGPVFDVSVDVGRLAPEVEGALYFVVAESLANAVRHAGASRVAVTARRTDETVTLEVVDDGVGGAGTKLGGSGLVGLGDRVAALAGTLHIDSPPGAGTRLSVVIPTGLPSG